MSTKLCDYILNDSKHQIVNGNKAKKASWRDEVCKRGDKEGFVEECV